METMKIKWLRWFLRLLAVGFLAAFIPWITLIVLGAPILAPGGQLAPLLRFRPYNPAYETMLSAIYIAWAVMLWRASGDPARHRLFLDFTIWATAAHAAVMLVVTPLQKGLVMMFIESVPLVVIAGLLLWLRPASRAMEPADRSRGTRAFARSSGAKSQKVGAESQDRS